MARLFISHSSVNNAEAIALRDWLAAEGWDDVFLDLDPARGIAAGERWERALSEAAKRCEAVIFLVSKAWLASDWCRREFNLARRLNKRLFAMLIEEIAAGDLPSEMTGTWQLVNLICGGDYRMVRVERG
ncbi:MAG: toll/interleukin-1 receptor domain-containing protein [Rhodomicrobium sp.]